MQMTEQAYIDADQSSEGFCRACGEAQGGCEPDARGYECESCGKPEVYGAAELLIMGEISFVAEED